MTLHPVEQILEKDGSYESTGDDPQFELKSDRKNLPRRWVFISYRAEDIDGILAPALYCDKGRGYHEDHVIHLPHVSLRRGRLIRLPYNLQSLRLDATVRQGSFNLTELEILEVGFVPLMFILCWRELCSGLGEPGSLVVRALRGAGYFCTKGAARARDRLASRHQLRQPAREFLDYQPAAMPVAPVDTQWQELVDKQLAMNGGHVMPAIDIIVPVYKGYDETLNCIYQVLSESNDALFELVVINDGSPERLLVEKLRELSGKGLFALHENRKNLGFVKTVNAGMRLHQDRDVVLLNADTEVYNNWLDRLHRTAYREDHAGTVTPLSNNAEICSYPYIVRDNNMQLELPYKDLDLLAATVNAEKQVLIPTGVGFCMYIRRACLDETGYFDEEEFGKGYGEENDFCMRAAAKGWVHLLAADTFVRHMGGSSFGAEKRDRVLNAIDVINARYPGYNAAIQRFLDDDPVFTCRKNLDIGRLDRASNGKVFLLVSHNWGGGTEKHLQDMAEKLSHDGVRVYYLRPHTDNKLKAVFSCPDIEFLPNLPELDLLDTPAQNAELLSNTGVTHVHVHNLAGFGEQALTALPEMIRHAGLEYDVTLHDYMTICPRIHLTDEEGRYCGEPDKKSCMNCIQRYGTPFGTVDINRWRADCHALLQGARKVFVPNEDVAVRLKQYYPDVSYSLRPHMEPYADRSEDVHAAYRAGEAVRVGIIGAIGPHKGSHVLQACARDAQQRGLPLEFVVIGYTNIEELIQEPNVTVTGKYQECMVHELVREQRLHVAFFPATWPETYSYTLSLAVRMGLKPVAFDIGAIADRMRQMGCGEFLMPFDLCDSPSMINDFLLRSVESGTVPNGYIKHHVVYGSLLSDYFQMSRHACS